MSSGTCSTMGRHFLEAVAQPPHQRTRTASGEPETLDRAGRCLMADGCIHGIEETRLSRFDISGEPG